MKYIIALMIVVTVLAELPVVPSYDLLGYLGDWYEVASSPAVHDTFERGGRCSRARYGQNTNGTLSVYNKERAKSGDGPIKDIKGHAYIPDKAAPAKLRVYLEGAREANYWIVYLGPQVNGKYEWALVSEPNKLFMWVLARNPKTYLDKYEDTAYAVAQDLGFTGLFNRYVARDFSDCVPYDD